MNKKQQLATKIIQRIRYIQNDARWQNILDYLSLESKATFEQVRHEIRVLSFFELHETNNFLEKIK